MILAKLTEPMVIRDEPAEAYHAKTDFISSSPLPMMAKSPAHFYKAWRTPTDATPAMDRGTFMHKILLELDINSFVARPLNEEGELVRSNSKRYAEFLAANPGKTPVHPDLYMDAVAILAAACNHRAFIKAFELCDKEVSLYGTHSESRLPIKARPDMFAKDGSFILDVKTTSDMARFERQIFNLGYDVRLAHYGQTHKAVFGRETPETYIFAMEQSAPYGTRMFRLSKGTMATATAQHTQWMNEIAVCVHDNRWPGYSDDIFEVERPKFLDSQSIVQFDEVG